MYPFVPPLVCFQSICKPLQFGTMIPWEKNLEQHISARDTILGIDII